MYWAHEDTGRDAQDPGLPCSDMTDYFKTLYNQCYSGPEGVSLMAYTSPSRARIQSVIALGTNFQTCGL